jgi:hypothetical protein
MARVSSGGGGDRLRHHERKRGRGGHFFYLVHADRFNAQIRDFMARHE